MKKIFYLQILCAKVFNSQNRQKFMNIAKKATKKGKRKKTGRWKEKKIFFLLLGKKRTLTLRVQFFYEKLMISNRKSHKSTVRWMNFHNFNNLYWKNAKNMLKNGVKEKEIGNYKKKKFSPIFLAFVCVCFTSSILQAGYMLNLFFFIIYLRTFVVV